MKTNDSKNLLELFVNQINKEDLPDPDRDNEAFLEVVEIYKEFAKRHKKYREEIGKIEAAQEKMVEEKTELNLKELATTSKEKARAIQVFSDGPEQVLEQPDYVPSIYDPFCEEITIKVCKEQALCVDTPMPVPLIDITGYLNAGSLSSENSIFRFADSVSTQSGYEQHHGEITIRAGVALVEQASVSRMGMKFRSLIDQNGDPEWNGGCLTGYAGSGVLVMAWKNELSIMKPGQPWKQAFPIDEHIYMLQGREISNVRCWITNVLGESDENNLYYDFPASPSYPQGTQFLNEISLEYYIIAFGDKGGAEGSASVWYNLEVNPYMNIEACSWIYPDTITINVSDYIKG